MPMVGGIFVFLHKKIYTKKACITTQRPKINER